MNQVGTPLVGTYDYGLIALSIFLAISASYGALDLGVRVTAARGWIRSIWVAGGASAMGLGIWSMHFTGMLAFHLPVPVAYHWPTVLLSLLAAIFGSGVALYVVSGENMGLFQAVTGSVIVGLAIAGMHYIGMAAMRLSAVYVYSPLFVSLSILIAVIASFAAIFFTFYCREDFKGTTLAKLLGAGVMGAAIFLMHYAGMMSASFFPSNVFPNMSSAVGISSLGLGGIVIGTLVVQGAAIFTSSIDRQFAAQAQELQTSQRFRQIADTLRDVLVLCKPDFSEVLFANRAYEAIWGRTLESLYADPHSWLESVHPEDRERVQNHVRLLIGGQSIENLEYRVVRPDGSMSWVRLQTHPILDDRGNCYRILVSIHEFTMRKQAEDARRQIEEQYRTVAETATDAVISIDESNQILFANPATFKLFGYDSAELVGRPVTMLMPEFLREVHKTSLQRYLATGQRHINWQGIELIGLRRDGNEFPIEVSLGEVIREGQRVFTGFIRDISERKQAEDRLRQVIDAIPALVWSALPDGSRDFLNQPWMKYSGLSRDEALGWGWTKAIPPEDRTIFLDEWRRALIAEEPFEREVRFRRADGEYRWFLLRAVPLRNEQGKIVKWYGTSNDIDDRKRAEDRVRLIIETIPTLVWTLRPDGAVDFVNQRWIDYTGITLEEAINDPTRPIHPEDLPRVIEKWRPDLAAGKISEDELRLRRADGEYRWFLIRTTPLRDERGNVLKWYGVSIDIEDRKQAEEVLRSSEGEQREIAAQLEKERSRLVEAQEVAKMGSWEAELQSLNVIWSEQTHRIFETDPSRFHPTRPKFREFIHPEDRAKVDEAFAESLDKRSPSAVEYRIVMPDGRVKFVEERWQAFHDEEGKPVRLAGSCRDITERVRAEEELQRLSGQLLKLQDEERRRISRELHDSTGQNLVALATDLSQLRAAIPASSRKLRELASRCQELATQCIREVRTLSYVMYPPLLDESGLADAIRHFAEGFSNRSGIKVELEVSANFGRMREDVELALFRVVQESLANIHRHSGSPRAKIVLERRPDYVAVEVSDSGRGTSGKKLRTNKGMPFQIGIGISSMIERVKLIGGRLEIVSVDSGTTVRAIVPEVGASSANA